MGHIYGFLRYFGRPFNLRKRAGSLQIFMFFTTSVLSCWILWKGTNPIWATKLDWFTFFVVFVLITSESSAVIFFSSQNLRPRHPLIAIVEELKEIMDAGATRNFSTWCYVALGFTLPHLLIAIYHDVRTDMELMQAFLTIFALVKEFTILMHLAQVLLPFQAIASCISQVRTRMQICCLDPESDKSKTLELLVIEQRLEEIFNQLIEEYGIDFICIVYISTWRSTLCMCGVTMSLRKDLYPYYSHLAPILLLSILSCVYRIWSAAHGAQAVRSQMEQFHSELYTECLQDMSQKLVKNDLVSMFLERGPSYANSTKNIFLPLDHSLFFRMLSGAVTWVFIIIQFVLRNRCEKKISLFEV